MYAIWITEKLGKKRREHQRPMRLNKKIKHSYLWNCTRGDNEAENVFEPLPRIWQYIHLQIQEAEQISNKINIKKSKPTYILIKFVTT